MDASAYIDIAYGFAALLIGGLVLHTVLAARAARKALAAKGSHEA